MFEPKCENMSEEQFHAERSFYQDQRQAFYRLEHFIDQAIEIGINQVLGKYQDLSVPQEVYCQSQWTLLAF